MPDGWVGWGEVVCRLFSLSLDQAYKYTSVIYPLDLTPHPEQVVIGWIGSNKKAVSDLSKYLKIRLILDITIHDKTTPLNILLMGHQ